MGDGSQTRCREMTSPQGHSPRRYFVDDSGRRVLIGLTIEETFEFETLDNLPALDEPGAQVAEDEKGASIATREKRWRELYRKHDIAWTEWKTRAQADRREASGFVKYN
jgi:hypothetical protein